MLGRLTFLSIAGLLSVVTVFVLLCCETHAQEPLILRPSKLVIAAESGEIINRQIIIQATRPITNFSVMASDLELANNTGVISARRIAFNILARSIQANEVITANLTIDLNGIQSGEYAGELVLLYDGETKELPILLKGRDKPTLPIVVLIIGTVLGLILNHYRAQGKPRDEVLIRINRMRAQLRADPTIHASFQHAINTCFLDTEVAIQGENWDVARKTVTKAEEVFVKWRKSNQQWLNQLTYGEQLKGLVKGSNSDELGTYIRNVLSELDNIDQEAPFLEDPFALRMKLDSIRQKFERYQNIELQIDQLDQLWKQLRDREEEDRWQQRSLQFRHRLKQLTDDDDGNYALIVQDIATDTNELRQVVERSISVNERARSSSNSPATAEVPQPPQVQSIVANPITKTPDWRLKVFRFCTYASIVFMLLLAGMIQLYGFNQTFGANFWSDYGSLIAWGFGAELTRSAILDIGKNSGLPI